MVQGAIATPKSNRTAGRGGGADAHLVLSMDSSGAGFPADQHPWKLIKAPGTRPARSTY